MKVRMRDTSQNGGAHRSIASLATADKISNLTLPSKALMLGTPLI